MTTAKTNTRLVTVLLGFSFLISFGACGNEGVETRREPPKTVAAVPPAQRAMLEAAVKGDTAKVKELLFQGVSVNVLGPDHNTPIMEAGYAGHLDTVRLLLDYGADLSMKKSDGATPMALARSKDVADLFRNVNALVDASAKGNVPALKELIDKGTPLNGLDEFGHTALTEAAYNGNIAAIKALLEKGANPNIKKSDGETPLSLANGRKHPDIAALLNEAIAKQAKAGATPTVTSGTTPAAK
jgi:uncharacterized protein